MITASTPLRFLKGVGEGRAGAFAGHGIETAGHLLWFFPHRYEDRRHPVRIADVGRHLNEPVLIRGRVISAQASITPRKRMKLFEAAVEDGTGAVKLVWFNQPYLADQIRRGDHLMLFGTPKGSGHGHLQIESPDWEKIDDPLEAEGGIVPIYSKVANVPPKTLRKLVTTVAAEVLPAMEDPLPPVLRERLGVIGLRDALAEIHAPRDLTPEFLSSRSPAHLRVILQEFFSFQLALRLRRAMDEKGSKGRVIRIDDSIREEVRRVLPFRLTRAQKRVLKEIAADLQSEKPMYRLLQGDVGSGKTIVALIAAMIAIRNGHQVALLAPTEILAEQHTQRIRQLVDNSIVMATSTGSLSAGERRTLLAGLREGYVQLVVGTHALLEPGVQFKSLGLCIVDEQHRFGVEQRQKLFAKGEAPDVLVMTATPIPRSLALAMYGDLELSVIDELPPGRLAVTTAVRSSAEMGRVHEFVEKEVRGGAQAYIVYPIIDESTKTALRPLTAGLEEIRTRFPALRVGSMHGRMEPSEKESTMQQFKRGEIDILISTTVIEVGIDVPNASIMLIIDADRFGLSQLHQLRGRVGRGERKSYCILEHEKSAPHESVERLHTFARTRDGFEVADLDLEQRGPGEFLGTRQAGVTRFRFGNILRDHELMERARDVATEVVAREGVETSRELLGRLLGTRIEAAARD